jgi:hypothetical protein
VIGFLGIAGLIEHIHLESKRKVFNQG